MVVNQCSQASVIRLSGDVEPDDKVTRQRGTISMDKVEKQKIWQSGKPGNQAIWLSGNVKLDIRRQQIKRMKRQSQPGNMVATQDVFIRTAM